MVSEPIASLILALIAFTTSVWLTGRVRAYALARHLLDVPNVRSSHSTPTPRGGGVAIVIAVLLVLIVGVALKVMDWKLALALGGGGLLVAVALINRGVPLATASAIYTMCLMAMLAASAVYNLTKPSPHRRILRRIDEAAIFLLMAGSYTPFTVQLLPPEFAFGVTVAIWMAAFAGAAGKVLWPELSDRAWCFIYLAFG